MKNADSQVFFFQYTSLCALHGQSRLTALYDREREREREREMRKAGKRDNLNKMH